MGQKNLNYLLDVLKKSQVKLELGDSLNKELDDLLKNSPLESEYKNSYYKSTNFTPKKKPSLFARFKKSVNNFFKKIKNSKVVKFIFNLWSNNVTKPIQERKAKKSREKYVKELKKNFNETFNVDTNHINKLIDATKPNLNEDYKIDHLIENSVEINKLKSKGKVGDAAALTLEKPLLKATNAVEFVVYNKSAEERILADKTDLMTFLRAQLNNYIFTLDVTLTKEPSNVKLYTPQDKYKRLLELNPSIGKLKQTFDLDIEF
jgi:hypothetical protein